MKTFVKCMAILLAFVFAAGIMLTGCGSTGKKAENVTKPETAKEEAKKEEPKKEAVKIKYLSWESVVKANQEAVIKEFEAKNPGIKVEMEFPAENNNGEYMQKVDIRLLSGEEIDVIVMPGSTNLDERARKGIMEPLDGYFTKEGIKYEDKYTFGVKTEGKTYGIPADVKEWFIMINKNHLDEANLPVPKLDWTWNDYRDYAKKLTKGEGKDKRYGSYFHNWEQYNYMNMYTTKMDNPLFKDESTHNLAEPKIKDFIQLRFDLEQKDKVQIPYFEVKSQKMAYRDVFFKGQASMVPTGSWMLVEIKDTAKYPHDFVTTFAPLPRWKDGPEGYTFTESHFYSVASNSKKKDEAYKFIRFLTTEGMKIKAAGLSAEKGADSGKLVDNIVAGGEKLYDLDGLKKVLNNPKRTPNVIKNIPPSNKAVVDAINQEAEKFLVGGAKLDDVLAAAIKRADEAVKGGK